MKHEEALKLMDVMIRMGYSNECIVLTLMRCEEGMGIGHALIGSVEEIRKIRNE